MMETMITDCMAIQMQIGLEVSQTEEAHQVDGYSLGSAMISWFSRKQSSVSLSMAEAEYIATCSASCEAIWLRKLMSGLFDLEMDTTVILCDNQSCIKMTENLVFHRST